MFEAQRLLRERAEAQSGNAAGQVTSLRITSSVDVDRLVSFLYVFSSPGTETIYARHHCAAAIRGKSTSNTDHSHRAPAKASQRHSESASLQLSGNPIIAAADTRLCKPHTRHATAGLGHFGTPQVAWGLTCSAPPASNKAQPRHC